MTSNLARHVAALAADPSDARAFAALEEGYFLAAEWDKLVALYRKRLEDPALEGEARASVHCRLGQILEERCLDIDLAIQEYTAAIRIHPGDRLALRQLRHVHAQREAWDLVLQIAELELAGLQEPYERAVFFAEMGDVWLRQIRDLGEAMTCFEQALAVDPQHKDALAGLARTLEAQGNVEAAAATWERLISCVRGPDRAAPLVSLAALLAGPLDQGERAIELYRRALGDDPRNEAAVEALSVSAGARGQWELLADLFERRFRLAAGARRRTAIALEAGYMQLERLGNVEAARLWFERAQEMSTEDVSVLSAFVDLERKSGSPQSLADAIDRLVRTLGASAPLRLLLEAASLHTEQGDDEKALAHLELAARQCPDDPLVLEGLASTYSNLLRADDLAAVLERRAALSADDPEARAAALAELGHVQATQLEDLAAAQDAYERAFEALPSLPGVASALEGLYRKTESWSDLRRLLERATETGPADERCGYYCSLGELLEEHFGEHERSGVCFEAALALRPEPRALQGLARLADRSGDTRAMIQVLEREAALCNDPQRQGELAHELATRHAEHGDLEPALSWADRALATAPGDRRHLETVASLQERLGRDDDLIRTLMRLEDVLEPDESAAIRRRIAVLLERRGDDERALSYWEAVLESEPDDLESLAALCSHYRALNRSEDLAPVLRKLADRGPEAERTERLDELARLLDEQLCDVDGAIVVLWRLSSLPDRPDGVAARLENLLERAGRFEELAQQLLESRRGLPDDSPAAIDLELRRAALLLDPLGHFDEAAQAFREVRRRAPDRSEATEGLERALRAEGDAEGLCTLLAEMAEATKKSDPERWAQLQLERAVLLEESLGELERARQAYTRLCNENTTTNVAAQAGTRLESLLERCGDWTSLRKRLEQALGQAQDGERLALHERIAVLCAERLDDPEGAASHLEAAGRLAPERPEPWRRLAMLYHQQDRSEDLLRVTEAELETEPDPERECLLRARAAALWSADPDEADRACLHYERLLEYVPGHADATGFLVEHYEAADRFADVARLLEARLAAVSGEAGAASGDDADRGLQISLRLRIAELRAEELDDPRGAIAMLEPALSDGDPCGPAAAPLADLYDRTGEHLRLIELCGRAAAGCAPGPERARWQLRLAGALAARGDRAGAAGAYREVLDQQPHDPEAFPALCDLYRQDGQAGPLAELLESSLARATQDVEVATRMELAALCEGPLAKPAEAFAHLRRVIELDGEHEGAFERAQHLAGTLQRYDEQLELIDRRLELRLTPDQRLDLLERRAGLLAGPIGAPEAAVGAYREVIALDPERRSARASLREVLEALGRWSAVLDCLYLDADGAGPAEKASIYERAVEVATAHVGQDAALPWLERLRLVRPQDPLVVARIADVHRRAGRFESVLRAIEDELALTHDPERERDLHLGRARILERDVQAPGRAIAALEAALALDPKHPEILRRLDELYDLAGRARDRAAVLEARLEAHEAPLELHLAAARLYEDELSEPERAIPHLLRAVFLTRTLLGGVDSGPVSTPAARAALLADLAGTLRAAGREEAWARASEAELRVIEADLRDHPEPTAKRDGRRDRCNLLRRDLAIGYADELADPAGALRHMRVLVDGWQAGESGARRKQLDRIEQRYLDLLRRDANWMELERRLAARLARDMGSPEEWLELARLRDERLHAPQAALDAYEAAVAARPSSLGAIRGLRAVAERLADWEAAARGLELELGLQGRWSPRERAALSRRLGELYWHRLGDLERAADAYRAALDADPGDLDAIRSLESLQEARGSWDAAVDLYEQEAALLGEGEPERRKQVWLLVATLSARHLDDARRALRGYEQAADVSVLAPDDRLARARLHRKLGENERFAEVYADWCDDPGAGASCDEHLVLVEVLTALGRRDDALARARVAVDCDRTNAAAWSTLARLHRDRGQLAEAARAWEASGLLRLGREAALDLQEAALLVEDSDPDACLARLRSAIERDGGSLLAHAHRARVAAARGHFEEAEEAAGRALDLDAAHDEVALGAELHLETALVGGRAARARDRLDAAILFFGAALELDPANTEALEAQCELLFERGDLAAACDALEARISQGPDAGHAERLAMLGSALELMGETDAATERFADAVTADPLCSAGHAGLARLAQKAGRIDDAITALEGWASAARADDDLTGCAARLLHAAEIEMGHDRLDDAEAHLREALRADADLVRAWVLLAEILADGDRVDDLVRLVPEALDRDAMRAAPDGVARLSLLYARALERQGESAGACQAYAETVAHDPRCAEAALAQARLLRACGEWSEAARVLRGFCDGHPEADHRSLAEAQYKLARLLAGPLEDMDGAVRCFTRALEIAPDHPKARKPLASLLAVVPERWDEALVLHAAILDEEPTCSASYRALLQIARGRDQHESVRFGLAVLRALGSASPAERVEAAACLPRAVVEMPALEDPIGEIARRLVQQAAEAIEQVLPAPPTRPDAHPDDFGARLRTAQRELCAVGLEPLSDAELHELLVALAAMALGDEAFEPTAGGALDTDLQRGLERALGRWTRRKLRRVLDGTSLDQIRALDPARWRSEVQGLAAARAVDLAHGDLRHGLVWLCRGEPGLSEEIGETDDLTARIDGCPPARELLRGVAASWCQQLARRDRPRRS